MVPYLRFVEAGTMKSASTFTLRELKTIMRNGLPIGRVVPAGKNFVGIIGDFDDEGHCTRKWRQGPACDDAAIAFAEVVARYQGYKDALTMAHNVRAAESSPTKKKTATAATTTQSPPRRQLPAHQVALMKYIDNGTIRARRAA